MPGAPIVDTLHLYLKFLYNPDKYNGTYLGDIIDPLSCLPGLR